MGVVKTKKKGIVVMDNENQRISFFDSKSIKKITNESISINGFNLFIKEIEKILYISDRPKLHIAYTICSAMVKRFHNCKMPCLEDRIQILEDYMFRIKDSEIPFSLTDMQDQSVLLMNKYSIASGYNIAA